MRAAVAVWSLWLCWLPTGAIAAEPIAVVVEVSGLATARGAVECVLWSGGEGFPTDLSRAVTRVRVPAAPVTGEAGGKARCTFSVAAPGRYAVSMIHDENDNGRLDTGVFGIPTERYGFSRDPRPFMRAPRFDEAAFEVTGEGASVRVTAR